MRVKIIALISEHPDRVVRGEGEDWIEAPFISLEYHEPIGDEF